ncbi:MAG: GNAT family N-acetyltransferase [Sphingobacteriales bacterium]|nr:MAG: GNAT family N-acetyltransferase [Sphingobacteriales bacterium]
MREYQILPYRQAYKPEVVDVWERSVLATHHFLVAGDVGLFKSIVEDIDFSSFPVYCLVYEDAVAGFMGIVDRKLEMLFLAPEVFGMGYGRKMMEFAITHLNVNEVDVNEQNHDAVKFYEKMGFVTYERTEKDSMGKEYPILKMKLRA